MARTCSTTPRPPRVLVFLLWRPGAAVAPACARPVCSQAACASLDADLVLSPASSPAYPRLLFYPVRPEYPLLWSAGPYSGPPAPEQLVRIPAPPTVKSNPRESGLRHSFPGITFFNTFYKLIINPGLGLM